MTAPLPRSVVKADDRRTAAERARRDPHASPGEMSPSCVIYDEGTGRGEVSGVNLRRSRQLSHDPNCVRVIQQALDESQANTPYGHGPEGESPPMLRDDGSFRTLYLTHSPGTLEKFRALFYGSEFDPEFHNDVMWSRFYQKWMDPDFDFEDPRKVKAYLYQCVRNEVRSKYRQLYRTEPHVSLEELTEAPADQNGSAEDQYLSLADPDSGPLYDDSTDLWNPERWTNRSLLDALSRLPRLQKIIISEWAQVEPPPTDRDLVEIFLTHYGRVISEAAVKKNRQRATQALKKHKKVIWVEYRPDRTTEVAE